MSGMKKILILGGSHRDIPIIKAAQELGFITITVGDRDYYLGHSYADSFYRVNFNDLSKVKEIMVSERVDYLIPGSGEESYLATVQLSQELNIGCYDCVDVAKLVHNKWRFKEFCLNNNISTPNGCYYTPSLDLRNIQLPVIVKPTNLSGGRGVDVVYDFDSLKESITRCKKISSEIFLEDFVDGDLIAYSVFIVNQKIVYEFVGRDDSFINKYLVASAYPIHLKDELLYILRRNVEKMARKLPLVDGMFHLQIIIRDEVPYIIDVTRRIPGDLYPYLMEYCDKVNYSKSVVKSYIGQPIGDGLEKSSEQEFVIRHCVMSDKNGIFKGIEIDAGIEPMVVFRLDLMDEGSRVNDFLTNQISIIFIRLPGRDCSVTNNINSLIRPVVQ